MNFGMDFSVSLKSTVGILIGITLNLYITLCCIDIFAILNLPSPWYVFLFICVFNIVQQLIFIVQVFHFLG